MEHGHVIDMSSRTSRVVGAARKSLERVPGRVKPPQEVTTGGRTCKSARFVMACGLTLASHARQRQRRHRYTDGDVIKIGVHHRHVRASTPTSTGQGSVWSRPARWRSRTLAAAVSQRPQGRGASFADHQNKADISSNDRPPVVRRRQGLDMLIVRPRTRRPRRSPMAKVDRPREEQGRTSSSGAATSDADWSTTSAHPTRSTGSTTPWSLANGTGNALAKTDKWQELVLRHSRLRVRPPRFERDTDGTIVEKRRRQGASARVRASASPASDFSSFLLQAQSSQGSGHRPRQRRR